MKRLILLIVLITHGKLLFAESDAFGPVVTYATRELEEFNVFFYTAERERSSLYISNDVTNYVIIEDSKSKYHSFDIPNDGSGYFFYRIISNNRDIKGKHGTVFLPERRETRFAVYGQSSGSYDTHRALGEAVFVHEPHFSIHTGNLIEDSMNTDEWHEFFESGETLLSSSTLIPVIGSGDFYNTLWKRIFDTSNGRDPFYSYQLPNLTLIVLNSSMYFEEDSVQFHWMIDELERHDPDHWLLVSFHHSPFGRADIEAADMESDVIPVLEEYGVDVVFTGSSLFYERSKREDILYINSGGSQASMQAFPSYNAYRETVVAGKNHFLIGNATPLSLELAAYDLEGNELDRITLEND